jgi:hypothetical protein
MVESLDEAVKASATNKELNQNRLKWQEVLNEARFYLSQNWCGGCDRTLEECRTIQCPYREAVATD